MRIASLFLVLLASCSAEAPEPPAPEPASLRADDSRCALELESFGANGRVDPGNMIKDYQPKNTLSIDDAGHLLWNEATVSERALRLYFELTVTMSPVPDLYVEADPAAPCATVGAALLLARRTASCTPSSCAFRSKKVSSKGVTPPLLEK